jgi:hypothetical protein
MISGSVEGAVAQARGRHRKGAGGLCRKRDVLDASGPPPGCYTQDAMRAKAKRSSRGLPPAPCTAAAWLALPEIAAGRYLVVEVGWVSSGRENAVTAGVDELPAPRGEVDNGSVALPAVTVIGDDGRMQMFRLPVCYAALVRRLVDIDDFAWREPLVVAATSLTELPCHFVVGGREDVYLSAEQAGNAAAFLN